MPKKIKIECGGAGWGTKIFVDGKDLLKEVPGIYGVELGIFVDGVTELKLHQRATPVEFNGKVKLIEIFGEKNYCLIDRKYIQDLKKQIEELRGKLNKEREKLFIIQKTNEELKQQLEQKGR